MEQVQKLNQRWFSPESAGGSVGLSILAHAFIYGAVVLIIGTALKENKVIPEAVTDLSYEVFDAPPEPVKEVHHVVRSAPAETTPVTKTVVETAPHEMQDEKSDIAGTQTAQKQATTIGSTSNGDAQATPYYKIKPKYPRAALVAGTEGWVMLQIDVNEKGEVENVRVIGGAERNMFEAEARRAVAQWKYRPFLDANGQPIRKADHQVRVDFKLSDAGLSEAQAKN